MEGGLQPARGFSLALEFLHFRLARWGKMVAHELMALVPSLVIFAVTLVRGWKTSPFSGRFAIMRLLPHFFGLVLRAVCPAMAYGSDYKATWASLLAPVDTVRKFGGGVHAALWTVYRNPARGAVLPAALAWGPMDSALFAAFSAAMASLYLVLKIRLIDGVPFGKWLQSNRNYFISGILVLFGTFAAIPEAERLTAETAGGKRLAGLNCSER